MFPYPRLQMKYHTYETRHFSEFESEVGLDYDGTCSHVSGTAIGVLISHAMSVVEVRLEALLVTQR